MRSVCTVSTARCCCFMKNSSHSAVACNASRQRPHQAPPCSGILCGVILASFRFELLNIILFQCTNLLYIIMFESEFISVLYSPFAPQRRPFLVLYTTRKRLWFLGGQPRLDHFVVVGDPVAQQSRAQAQIALPRTTAIDGRRCQQRSNGEGKRIVS